MREIIRNLAINSCLYKSAGIGGILGRTAAIAGAGIPLGLAMSPTPAQAAASPEGNFGTGLTYGLGGAGALAGGYGGLKATASLPRRYRLIGALGGGLLGGMGGKAVGRNIIGPDPKDVEPRMTMPVGR